MAYGIKYRFKFESVHGVDYTVNLLEDGYDGSVTTRPLGKAPVIRMQESKPFRATSCNLTLECQVDGEFAELYTSDPLQFRIDVFRGDGAGTLILYAACGRYARSSHTRPSPPWALIIFFSFLHLKNVPTTFNKRNTANNEKTINATEYATYIPPHSAPYTSRSITGNGLYP